MTAEGACSPKTNAITQPPGGRISWLAQRLRVSTWQVWLVWGVTRVILLAAAIIGQRYCDPQFYHFAGQFARGPVSIS